MDSKETYILKKLCKLRNHRIATSMEIQGDPERTIESAIQQ